MSDWEQDAYHGRVWNAFRSISMLGDVEIKRLERGSWRLLLKRPKDESVESFTASTPEECVALAAKVYLIKDAQP